MKASDIERKCLDLLEQMTLDEKIGQLCLVNGAGNEIPEALKKDIAEGRIGAILNEVDVNTVNALQKLAFENSRLRIPLLNGRDVIHGFKTIFPIPLGQAASWNPQIIRKGAHVAAVEAASAGINWTYAPMMDISRDPRWGRVAEMLGEDPYLTSILAAAMVEGFQGKDLAKPESIAACAKHFAGYGASEAGKDYNTTNIPENELRNVHLPPFKAALDAGVASFMTSFGDLDGVPASANQFLLQQVLRKEWQFNGFVVSDWNSIGELIPHGIAANDREAAREAAQAGLDMEMVSTTYRDHLAGLIDDGHITIEQVNEMVANVLRIKFRLGLFDNPYTDPKSFPGIANTDHLQAAKVAALESCVLLKNKNDVLPLSQSSIPKIAVIGPLADAPYEQLGTWIFDGEPQYSQTPLQAIREFAGEDQVSYAPAMDTTRSRSRDGFDEAINAVKQSDVALLFLGEESILSGEAHCRADISLPGNQEELVAEIAAQGKPVILVIMAGRPLVLDKVIDKVDAILFAWHPGSMAGPAIADLLFGVQSPSGKLPVTFPRSTGQIPVYYAHKNTGRPATPETVTYIDDIEVEAPQDSLGNVSFYLDLESTPQFPFGFGLSYTKFEYTNIQTSMQEMSVADAMEISAEVANVGNYEADEIVQLYIRDLFGSVTRPVRELKGFQKVRLKPGERRTVGFRITADDLAFYGRDMQRKTEPGDFHCWIGGSSLADLGAAFVLK